MIVNIFTLLHYGKTDSRVKKMQTFLGKLKGLREDNDLTQAQVAEVLGTSQTMYARYERGANELPIRHLIALCKYYRVSADYFLGISEYKK
jgi:transcriptional regulator with XRE-family HTH domain